VHFTVVAWQQVMQMTVVNCFCVLLWAEVNKEPVTHSSIKEEKEGGGEDCGGGAFRRTGFG
jgi:hypothetical protein